MPKQTICDTVIYYETKEGAYDSETFPSKNIAIEDIVKEGGFTIVKKIDNNYTWTWIPYHRIYEIIATERVSYV